MDGLCNPVLLSQISWFRSLPTAGDFCFRKSRQNHRAGHDGLANVPVGSTALRFSPDARRR
jgi:hypothetical protein